MIEKDRGKRKGKVELVMHRFLFTFENLMDPFYILTRIIVKCRLASDYFCRFRPVNMNIFTRLVSN